MSTAQKRRPMRQTPKLVVPLVSKQPAEPVTLSELGAVETMSEAQAMALLQGIGLPLPPTGGGASADSAAPADRAPRPPAEPSEEGSLIARPLSRTEAKLAAEVGSIYAMVGMLVAAASPADGVVIISASQARAEELVRVARHHPRLRAALGRLTRQSDYGALLIGHGTLLAAIAANHGWSLTSIVERLRSRAARQQTTEHEQQALPLDLRQGVRDV